MACVNCVAIESPQNIPAFVNGTTFSANVFTIDAISFDMLETPIKASDIIFTSWGFTILDMALPIPYTVPANATIAGVINANIPTPRYIAPTTAGANTLKAPNAANIGAIPRIDQDIADTASKTLLVPSATNLADSGLNMVVSPTPIAITAADKTATGADIASKAAAPIYINGMAAGTNAVSAPIVAVNPDNFNIDQTILSVELIICEVVSAMDFAVSGFINENIPPNPIMAAERAKTEGVNTAKAAAPTNINPATKGAVIARAPKPADNALKASTDPTIVAVDNIIFATESATPTAHSGETILLNIAPIPKIAADKAIMAGVNSNNAAAPVKTNGTKNAAYGPKAPNAASPALAPNIANEINAAEPIMEAVLRAISLAKFMSNKPPRDKAYPIAIMAPANNVIGITKAANIAAPV